MKFLKTACVGLVAILAVSCSGGASYDDCVAKAKEAMKAKGVPEASLQMMAEQSCAACKENKDACKTVIDALK